LTCSFTSEASTPVEEACDVLIKNNISSAPVYQAPSNNASDAIVHSQSYVGMFDYGDIIAYILLVLQDIPPPQSGNITFEIKDIIRRASEGKEVPVRLASGRHIENKCLLFVYVYNFIKNNFRFVTKEPVLLYFARSDIIICS
jgi:hypothetical protein